MKLAPLLLLTALTGLAGGCGGYPARSLDATEPEPVDPGEGGMILAVKGVDIPGYVAPARKVDPGAEINGAFGGLIGGMAGRPKADAGKNGEELKIILDKSDQTIVVVQPRGQTTLMAGDRVVVRRDVAGNATAEPAPSRR